MELAKRACPVRKEHEPEHAKRRVEARIREIERLSFHDHRLDVAHAGLRRAHTNLLDHAIGKIDSDDTRSTSGCEERKRSRTGRDIEDAVGRASDTFRVRARHKSSAQSLIYASA
jgi:hypothetical protein